MNVLEAAQYRIRLIFSEFDNVYVSFSGGKDSGVLLNLAMAEARTLGRRLGVFHMDYEAQYQATTDYVTRTLENNLDVLDVYHICLPLAAQCATSMHQDHWIPWDKDKRDLWVRPLPEGVICEDYNPLGFFVKGMWDYDLQNKFSFWIHNQKNAKRTCCLVGIRTQESLNRWRAIHSDNHYRNYAGHDWTKEMACNIYNAYPIFDWQTEDIWTANARFGWDYNKLYDLFYKAGVPLGSMRVASPFNDYAKESLQLYRVIDPKNWGRMIGRVDGVNFTGIYGGTTAMGWKSIKLPKGHTWKSYMEFLLSTLPKDAAENYKKKLATSIEFWETRGGALDRKTIKSLRDMGIKVKLGKKGGRHTNKQVVAMPYLDDTELDEFSKIPSYKRMCICILKNDHACKYMGFAPTKTETEAREKAMQTYGRILK